MNKKTAFMALSLLLVMIVGSFASASTSVVAKDSKNDVEENTYNSSAALATTEGQSKPTVDIVDIQYGTNAQGNATIELDLAGAPTLNNNTYYYLTLDASADNIIVQVYTGGYLSYDDYTQSYVSITDNSVQYDYNNTVDVSGNSIIFTMPRQVPDYVLNSTFDLNTVWYDANFTTSAQSSWTWYAMAWTGTASLTQINSQTSGTWWFDDINSSVSTINSGSSTLSGSTSGTNTGSSVSKKLPGLDAGSSLAVLILGSFVAIFEKRKRMN